MSYPSGMNSPIQFGNEGGIRSLVGRLAIPIKMNLMSNYQNGVDGKLTQYVDDVEDLTETSFPNLTLGDTGGIGQFPSQSINAPIWDNSPWKGQVGTMGGGGFHSDMPHDNQQIIYDGTQLDFGAEGYSNIIYPDQQKSYDEVLEALKGLGQPKGSGGAISSNPFDSGNAQFLTKGLVANVPEIQKNLFGYK